MKTNQQWKESINEKFYFMTSIREKSGNGIYAASHSIKPVDFCCAARGAKTVHLVGDFNNWHPILMARREEGRWFIQVWLPHGHHQYHFLVDGRPVLDPHAAGTACNERCEPVSLIAVS